MNRSRKQRLAFIVSHPIQYYVPLYRRLAQREDIEIKVFFTWHGGEKAVFDQGFRREFSWDIPLTEGYEYEVIPNVARAPGTHHFGGLRNPTLTRQVSAWQPDVIHLTGYAYASHLSALRDFHRRNIPLLFRGDSHLLDQQSGWKWGIKQKFLSHVYRWPAAFLYVGQANRAYYKAFGVPDEKLFYCPHSIEVTRFAEPDTVWEAEARQWRAALGIEKQQRVLLYTGKFEDKKQPVALMQAFLALQKRGLVLVMVGDGELRSQVEEIVQNYPDRFRLLPFQNQSRMPVVYRLGDLLILPSTYGETWGLAVNESLASGRPVLVSDHVGCAADLVQSETTGKVFPAGNWDAFRHSLSALLDDPNSLQGMRTQAKARAATFDILQTEARLLAVVEEVTKSSERVSV